ncbi:MAG: hypothetical protein PVJ57_03795 [Phycisphaerae bacterium]|jgi:hypothetical protein
MLRRLLAQADKAGVARSTIEDAAAAVQRYEDMLDQDVGGRQSLDALLSGWLPEARQNFEATQKQAAFRANSHLKGVMADVCFSTAIMHPSNDPMWCDYAGMEGLVGLRRLRPGAVVRLANNVIENPSEVPPRDPFVRETLEGRPIRDLHGVLMMQLCSSPLPEVEFLSTGNVYQYLLGGSTVGWNSPVDFVVAEVGRRVFPRYRLSGEHPRTRGIGAELQHPARTLLLDVLLHEDIWPECEFDLRIYDTAVRGCPDLNDPNRDLDQLHFVESIQFMGKGMSHFATSEIDGYVDALRYCCDKLGWAADKFRGYRCRIEYPFYGSSVVMALDLPDVPAPEELSPKGV